LGALKWKCDETCEHFYRLNLKVVSNPKSQANFDSVSKDEGNKEPMEKSFTPYEV
jgi:hypothetical protein